MRFSVRSTTVCVFLLLCGASGASDAPGSDCDHLSGTERLLCADAGLTRLDAQADTLFEVRMLLPMLMGERGAAQDEQAAFEQRTEACGSDSECLRTAYVDRIAALKATIEAAMQDYCRLKGICG